MDARPPYWTRYELGVIEAGRDRRPPAAPRPAARPSPSFPRLISARRARCVEMAAERRARRRVLKHLMEVEALVAHRDLQVHRARWTGDRRYIAKRERMLAAAERALVRVRAEAKRLGVA